MKTRQNTSLKGFTLVEIMIVVVIIGLLAAMAIPAFAKVRSSTRQKAVINNLRQIAGAAQQYFLEHGVSQVDMTQLMGTGTDDYLRPIQPVEGEIYAGPIYATTTQFDGVLNDGTICVYNF